MSIPIAGALLTGLLSSFHCAAMCGPIAVAGSCQGSRTSLRSASGYFVGRMIAYATVGALVGNLGRHALCMLPTETVQTAILVLVAIPAAWHGVRLLYRGRTDLVPVARLRRGRTLVSFLPKRGAALGIATGFLPCGMLMGAWMMAASTQHALYGAATMALFSLGSLPGLLLPIAARGAAAGLLHKLPRHVYGVAWCLLAVWLALRPLLMGAHHH